MINPYNCIENVRFFFSCFDVETRNRFTKFLYRNNKRALVNLQGKVGLFDIDTVRTKLSLDHLPVFRTRNCNKVRLPTT